LFIQTSSAFPVFPSSMMSTLAVYITFWNNGRGEDDVEWMLTARSTAPDRSATTFTYRIVLVAPGTNRWIEAHQTPVDPLALDRYGSATLIGAVLLTGSEVLEHVSLDTFDAFIRESEEAGADNPAPDRITDWGPELWTTARVAQLAMAEWIVLSPAAAAEFDFEFHNYARLRDRIAARKLMLLERQQRGIHGWDNVISLE